MSGEGKNYKKKAARRKGRRRRNTKKKNKETNKTKNERRKKRRDLRWWLLVSEVGDGYPRAAAFGRSFVRSFVHSFIHSFIHRGRGGKGGRDGLRFILFLFVVSFFFIYIFFCLPLNYSVQFFFYGAFAGGRSGWLRRLNLKKKCCFGNWRWNKKQLVKQLFCGNRRLIITSTKKMTSLTHFDGILAIF